MLKVKILKALSAALFITILGMSIFTGCGTKNDNISVNPQSPSTSVSAEERQNKAQLEKDRDAGLFVLVNKQNPVPENYEPEDLTDMTYCAAGRDPSTRFMRAEAVEKFNEMVEAAEAEGIEIVMTTAYRTHGFQNILWIHNVETSGSETEANKTSARPDESEHRTGLAVDISTKAVNYAVTTEFENTDVGQWVRNNGHKYGFIIRYPEDKVDITGYSYEAWHLRYVGETAATEIYEKGICLEEFLQEKGLATTLSGSDAVFTVPDQN